jgi:hypothetical protein
MSSPRHILPSSVLARPSTTLLAITLAIACASLLAACGGGGGGGAGSSSGNTDPGLPPATTSFAGSVSLRGAPLAGVTVIAFNTNTNEAVGTAVTDAGGHYAFSQLQTSCTACRMNFQFIATKDGYSFEPEIGNAVDTDRSAYHWVDPGSSWAAASGAAVTRSDFTGQFSNPGGGSAYILSVLNFDSVANGSVANGNFIAHDGSDPLVHLAASGQAQSYASGDDADMHAGVAWPSARWLDHHDGSVTDTLTGLTWLKDAGCLAPAAWSAALASVNQLANGACGLADGSSAGQWRLPNQWELESIVDESAAHPAIGAGNPFLNVADTAYWTSTSYYGGLGGSPSAWAIRMSDGRYINDGAGNLKATSSLGVWAVKGGAGGSVRLQATGMYVPYAAGDDGTLQAGVALPSRRMRDNGDGTLTDTVTGLVWLKRADCLSGTWSDAVATVRGLASGQCGLRDGSAAGAWRMPNRKEMASLADRALNNQADFFDTAWTSAGSGIPSAAAVFDHFVTLQYYWTSTTDAADPTQAWTVFSCDYGVYGTDKVATGYTLAVRD